MLMPSQVVALALGGDNVENELARLALRNVKLLIMIISFVT